MKRAEISQRWVLSFADLSLLLLAFFVMMQAQAGDRLKLVAGMRDAFGGDGKAAGDQSIHGFDARTIFEVDEAILKPATIAQLKAIGTQAAKAKKRVIVASQGRDGQTQRLDSWELAAARTTAVARALRAGGLTDAAIEITIPPMRATDKSNGQRISVQTF